MRWPADRAETPMRFNVHTGRFLETNAYSFKRYTRHGNVTHLNAVHYRGDLADGEMN